MSPLSQPRASKGHLFARPQPRSAVFYPDLEQKAIDSIIRKYASFDERKPDEYRYWQSRPAHERMDAVEEMIQAAYVRCERQFLIS
jgi:hypothetical protein